VQHVQQVQPPEKFSFKPEDWQRWIRRFERYRVASALDKASDENQVNTLIYTMGTEADDIIQSLGISEEEQKRYDVVKQKLENFFIIKRNVIFERAKFNLRCQQENEPVETFITDLFSLAEHCKFGSLREELIRDRIVVGIRDKMLSEKLQLEAELTLEKAMNLVRQRETVRKQQEFLKTEGKAVDSVSTRMKRHATVNTKMKVFDRSKKDADEIKCQRCLGPKHLPKNCPAKKSKCRKCGKKGHWQRACRSKIEKPTNEAVSGEIVSNDLFLGEIVIESVESHPWEAEIRLNGQNFQFKLDSGADVTVVSPQIYKQIANNQSLEITDKVLIGPCNYRLKCLGKFKAKLNVEGHSIVEDVYVVEALNRPLLSKKACVSLSLLRRCNVNEIHEHTRPTKYIKAEQQEYKENIINMYPKLFEGLGEIEGEYEIKLKPNAQPFALNVPRKLPFPMFDKTKNEIDRMLQMGVISKIDQPTSWCAPMVVTKKASGDIRVCVDLTKLNENVLRETYPLTSVEFTISKLSKSKIFSKIDANSAFWQRKLSESSHLLTTFITPWGRYCFNRLPYGISTGSEQFQKCMNDILAGLPGVESEIDDLIIHGETQKQHDERLHAVLSTLQKANVTLNKDKCIFNVTTIKALGQVISAEGVGPDPDKVKAINEIPSPKSVSEVRSFLGMINQFNKFTKHLATISKPLRELLSKSSAWHLVYHLRPGFS
jgi:hypothetical protein